MADATLQALQDEVAQAISVEQSAVTLINGLAAQIAALIAAGNNDPALQQLHDQLKAGTDALAAAVTTNTPAQPFTLTADQTTVAVGATVNLKASAAANFSLSASQLGTLTPNPTDATMATYVPSAAGTESITAVAQSDSTKSASVTVVSQ